MKSVFSVDTPVQSPDKSVNDPSILAWFRHFGPEQVAPFAGKVVACEIEGVVVIGFGLDRALVIREGRVEPLHRSVKHKAIRVEALRAWSPTVGVDTEWTEETVEAKVQNLGGATVGILWRSNRIAIAGSSVDLNGMSPEVTRLAEEHLRSIVDEVRRSSN